MEHDGNIVPIVVSIPHFQKSLFIFTQPGPEYDQQAVSHCNSLGVPECTEAGPSGSCGYRQQLIKVLGRARNLLTPDDMRVLVLAA